MQIKRSEGAMGFTLIETIMVMLVVALMITLGLPALQQMIHRSRLEGATRECAMMCHRARLEAIKQGVPVAVRFDTTDRTVEAWIDENGDGTQDPTETEMMVMSLPGTVDYAAPPGWNPVQGFTPDPDGAWVLFLTDGSIDESGQVHFGDARGNFLQLALEPIATANVEIKKWDATENPPWVLPQEGTPWEWK